MHDAALRHHLDPALREGSTQAIERTLGTVAATRGGRPEAGDLQELAAALVGYVRHAADLVEALEGGPEALVPLVRAAEAYLLAPLDVVPDGAGLLGLVDDAYVAHALLLGLAGMVAERGGRLAELDLGAAQALARAVLGEEEVARLDAFVAASLAEPVVVASAAALVGTRLELPGAAAIWGGAGPEEVERLLGRALGIPRETYR